MMTGKPLALYQVDAFSDRPLGGNPAAVIPLSAWLDDVLMQAIAEENNLSETAFFVPTASGFHIRWFTPKCEVRLCGHATLATAYVLFHCLGETRDVLEFELLGGRLKVTRNGEWLTLDFPAQPPEPCPTPDAVVASLGLMPVACLSGEDLVVVVDSEETLLAIEPKLTYLEQLPERGVIVTATSQQYDFVVRFFAPKLGIPEDSVTGSAYTQLAPYWASVTGKSQLEARQMSVRGGELLCELKGDRVLISGRAVLYLQGTIFI